MAKPRWAVFFVVGHGRQHIKGWTDDASICSTMQGRQRALTAAIATAAAAAMLPVEALVSYAHSAPSPPPPPPPPLPVPCCVWKLSFSTPTQHPHRRRCCCAACGCSTAATTVYTAPCMRPSRASAAAARSHAQRARTLSFSVR
eukprot:364891-Chlamydomonas_euryale.AAC.1